MKIPISLSRREDSWVWHYKKYGEYIVKGGYKCVILEHGAVTGASLVLFTSWWKHLWKIRVSHKVTILFWRSCHSYLPTKSSLKRRMVEISPWCPLYRREEETTSHALFGCAREKSI